MFLIDTSVLSAFAPGKPAVPEALTRWIEQNADHLFIASITIAEIAQGSCKLRRKSATQRADRLDIWLDQLTSTFADRIIALDAQIARETGALSDAVQGTGHAPDLADVIIAATASLAGRIVLTRNMRHFEPLSHLRGGFVCLDPFTTQPPEPA